MRRLLVSCSWSHPDQLHRLASLLIRHGYEYDDRTVFPDAPIPASSHGDLRAKLSQRIANVSTVVVLATEDAHRKELVNFEVEEAIRQGKRVVAVQPLGTAHGPVPRVVAEHADAIVSFRGTQITDALEGANIRNVGQHPIAEEEAIRDLAHWIARGTCGAVVVGAFTIESWLPRLNSALADLGVEVVSDGHAPDPGDVMRGALVGGGLGYLAGHLCQDARMAATLAVLGAAIGAGVVSQRAMKLRLARVDGMLHAQYLPASG